MLRHKLKRDRQAGVKHSGRDKELEKTVTEMM